MKQYKKKASFQLSVNFLVVLIICIVLLGIGVKLIATLLEKTSDIKGGVEKYMEDRLKELLDEGAIVAAYPDRQTIGRGEAAKFGLGIRNELGTDQDFLFTVEKDTDNSPTCVSPVSISFIPGEFLVKNNAKEYRLISITMPKDCNRGAHIFNIYVCNTTVICTRDSPDRYGDLEKVYVYLK